VQERKGLRKLIHHPVVVVTGGLLLGAVGVGIAIIVLVYFVQPFSTPETKGMVCYRQGDFHLWYPKDSSARKAHADLAAVLEKELHELTALLQVDPKLIPRPIDVFVHPNIAAMQASILKRKGPQAESTYIAPLDLLVGEDPRGRLGELVLAFGWGNCGSRILKMGMRLYAADPQRNFHGVVAALPDRLFLTLPQLMRLEEEHYFPSSLYEQFDSPYSPAAITSLSAFKQVLDLSPSGQENSVPALEAASFVQFLIETMGGLRAVKRMWGMETTDRLLQRITALSPAELSVKWRNVALVKGKEAPDFARLHAYYLLESGDPDAAYALAKEWYKRNLSPQELLTAGRCALTVGAFSDAAALAARAQGATKDELLALSRPYTGWQVKEQPRIRVIAFNADTAEKAVKELETAYKAMSESLSLSPDELPPRLTVFIYPDKASQREGEKLTALAATKSATLHITASDDIVYQVALVLPAYVWKADTYSRMLRTGVAVALARGEALEEEGKALERTGKWVPLSVVDFGTADKKVVEIEAGLMVRYLLHKFGTEEFRRFWTLTSPLDRYLSLDSALNEVYGLTRDQIEESLLHDLTDR